MGSFWCSLLDLRFYKLRNQKLFLSHSLFNTVSQEDIKYKASQQTKETKDSNFFKWVMWKEDSSI